jgi:hypothetical protein
MINQLNSFLEEKMTYQVIEDNGGGLFIFFFDGNDSVVLGVENLEFAQPGDLDNPSLSEAKSWDSQLDNPQAHYDDITGRQFGYEVVADQHGVYPSRMGRAAQIIFRVE